jgi:hypothetical protein
VQPEELDFLLEKLAYLSRGADFVVFAGSLPRGIDDAFYAEAVRDLNRRGAQIVLDLEGEPLRLATQAEPLLVSPNEREAEQLVGQEFHDDDDYLVGLETIAELGARNVLITRESGCWAMLRSERQTNLFRRSRRGSTRSLRSARATCTSPASSRRGSTVATTRRRSAVPSPPGRHRRSSSAPAVSSPVRPGAWSAESRSPSSSPSAATADGA